jgi:hypothetical protein
MRRILALQKLEVAVDKHASLAGSATSSFFTCCNSPD